MHWLRIAGANSLAESHYRHERDSAYPVNDDELT